MTYPLVYLILTHEYHTGIWWEEPHGKNESSEKGLSFFKHPFIREYTSVGCHQKWYGLAFSYLGGGGASFHSPFGILPATTSVKQGGGGGLWRPKPVGAQCSGSMTFWYGSGCGSGSSDPYLWLTDPDADAHPDLYQNLQWLLGAKNFFLHIFKMFSYINLKALKL